MDIYPIRNRVSITSNRYPSVVNQDIFSIFICVQAPTYYCSDGIYYLVASGVRNQVAYFNCSLRCKLSHICCVKSVSLIASESISLIFSPLASSKRSAPFLVFLTVLIFTSVVTLLRRFFRISAYVWPSFGLMITASGFFFTFGCFTSLGLKLFGDFAARFLFYLAYMPIFFCSLSPMLFNPCCFHWAGRTSFARMRCAICHFVGVYLSQLFLRHLCFWLHSWNFVRSALFIWS